MNWQETIEQIEKERNEKINAAAKLYAAANTKYYVGDVFTDYMGTIKILRVSVEIILPNPKNTPRIKYYGIELRKSDLQPKKNGAHRWAYLINEQK